MRPLVLGRYTDAAVRLGDLERLVSGAAAATDLAAWLAEIDAGPSRLDRRYGRPAAPRRGLRRYFYDPFG